MKLLILLLILVSFGASAASSREKAYKIHNRIAGVPPLKSVLDQMEALIDQGQNDAAVRIALNHKNFINIVMKNWVKPWSNRDQAMRVQLNDYVATILGSVRDDIGFDRILYDDIIYVVNNFATTYSNMNNDHYRLAEAQNVDLNATLVQRTQTQTTGLLAPSGVLTTRAAGEAFYSAGTNRRINRFTFINYMCQDYEDLHDISVPDYRVRKDVERNPGGDSRTYKNKCVGCHAGQDALGGAYAFYNFNNNQLEYTAGTVTAKINQNNNYNDGHRTVDDSWINLWVSGTNSKLGWKGLSSGNGAKNLNKMFARSHGFSQCIAKKVFKLVCMKDPVNTADKHFVEAQATAFETGYSLKNLIVETSVGCIISEEANE